MKAATGGPAFPSLEIYESWDSDKGKYAVQSDTATGMTLRDYFAAKAMHGEIVSSTDSDSLHELCLAALKANQTVVERIAFNAYRMADAMLKERERER